MVPWTRRDLDLRTMMEISWKQLGSGPGVVRKLKFSVV